MSISNISFLESWINFNCSYYPHLAYYILKEFRNATNINQKKYFAVELFKLVSEEIETISMWFLTLEKCAVEPKKKIYEIYLKENVRFKEFSELLATIKELSPHDFRLKYGIKAHVEFDEIQGHTDELIQELLFHTFSMVSAGKVDSDLLTMYNKSKHGLCIYSDPETPDRLDFIIGKTETGQIDTPGFVPTEELMEIMCNSVIKICTPLLHSIIRLKYYSILE
jgi:hypothetical protein